MCCFAPFFIFVPPLPLISFPSLSISGLILFSFWDLWRSGRRRIPLPTTIWKKMMMMVTEMMVMLVVLMVVMMILMWRSSSSPIKAKTNRCHTLSRKLIFKIMRKIQFNQGIGLNINDDEIEQQSNQLILKMMTRAMMMIIWNIGCTRSERADGFSKIGNICGQELPQIRSKWDLWK